MDFLHKVFSHSAEIVVGISSGLVAYNILTCVQGVSNGLRQLKVYEMVVLVATVIVSIVIAGMFVRLI